MKSKFIMYIILFFILLSLPIIPLGNSNIQKQQVIGEQYFTILSQNQQYLNYTVINGVNNEIIYTNNISQITLVGNKTIYQFKPLTVATYYHNAIVNLSINGDKITVYSGLPQLIRILLYTSGQREIVWGGYLSKPGFITTYGYINESGILELQYLNGSLIYSLNITAMANSYVELPYVPLVNVSYVILSNLPYETYIPLSSLSSLNNITAFSVALSSFYNTLLPSIIWKSQNSTEIKFFGINGTPVGLVKINIVNSSGLVGSSLLILRNLNVQYYTPKYVTVAVIDDFPVLIGISNNSVESTANITFSRMVYVNGETGVLVNISLDNISRMFLIINGNVYNVKLFHPVNIYVTNITIENNVFLAAKAVVNSNSSVFLITITPQYNDGFIVLEQFPNGSLVFLNQTNYFLSNGVLYVVGSSSGAYYVVFTSHPLLTITQTKPPLISYGANSLVIISGVIVILLAVVSVVAIRKRKS
ncbi:hypothetical protein V6M85_09370 [Sulfolobus tengchongensis]|uniref:Thermopsin n=1 Tax=Sulfolobus tengchongensis TaxID=207809 RepID=A0AAX4KZH5_9CREN